MNSRFFIHYISKKNYKISFILRLLLKWLKKLEIRNIIWLDSLTSSQIESLQKTKLVSSYLPKILNPTITSVCVNTANIHLYYLKDVILNTQSSHFIIKNNQIIMERLADANLKYCNYSTGYVKLHNIHYALYKCPSNRRNKKLFPSALYLGGNGVFNYYHWLIEIAPKLLQLTQEILNRYQIKTLILDESVQSTCSFFKILELFLSERQLQLDIVYENKLTDIHVKNLFYINNTNNIVFNSNHVLSSPTFSCIYPDLIHYISKICLNAAQFIDKSMIYPGKIFLARHEQAARGYNQTEIMAYFEKQGFTIVYLEQYNFLEQVKLFKHAQFIVGPSGAAWSNIIFCQPHVKAISWLPQQLEGFSVFSTLAHIVQCDLRFIRAQAEQSDIIHSRYKVSVEHLEPLYQGMKDSSHSSNNKPLCP